MKASELLFEKYKYKEAVKYASTLSGALINKVIHNDRIPYSITYLIDNINSIDSIPSFSLPNNTTADNLISWIIELLNENNNSRFIFKSSALDWKFWLDITIEDVSVFIRNIITESKVRDFYLSSIDGKIVKALLDEEYKFEFFIREYKD